MSPTLDTKEIQAGLPHREPFLFLDRVIAIDEATATGIKEVSASEDYFRGHFPGNPVMPGVLIVEALAQLAGLIEARRRKTPGYISYLAGIDQARFRNPVFPGDLLTLEARVVKTKKSISIAECTAKVGDKVACEATVMFAFAK